MSTPGTDTGTGVDPTPPAGPVSDDAARINGLMSSFNKEQAAHAVTKAEHEKAKAELTRLQTVLAEMVTGEAGLKEKLAELEGKAGAATSEVAERATTAESKVAELETQVSTLQAENARLTVIVDNPDLASYRAILPATADKVALDAVIATIRQARDADNEAVRSHLTGSRSGGGQTPRAPANGKWNAAQIKDYLDSSPPGEYEARLTEARKHI